MTSRRRRALLGLAAAGAVLAAALVWSPWSDGSSGSDPARPAADADEATGPDRHGTSAPGSPPAPIVDGGSIRLGLAGPLLADPVYASAASPSDLMVLDLLYDGLTRLPRSAPGSAGLGAEAVPAVAASWSPDAELKVWRFSLSPDARFSTGQAVTPADVVASLTHVIAGGDASPPALRLEAVQGFRAYLDGASPTVTGIRVVDERTVEIALDTPMAQLPVLLAAPSYGITDVRALASLAGSADLSALPGVGLTGGWQVDGTDDGALRLIRSDGTPGHLDAVELRPYADGAAAFEAFEEGDVDWAPVPGDRYGAAVDAFGDDAFTPFQGELALGLRVDDPALADPTFRRAIAAALDRDAIVAAVYPDAASPLSTVVPDGVPGGGGRGAAPAHSATTARRLLREAFPGGTYPQLSLDHEASPATTALMDIVAESLADVGITTTERSLDLDAYQRLLVSGDQQVFVLSWLGGAVSPDAYLDPLFRSSSPENLVGLRDASIDGALAEARATLDPTVATARWGAVERTVLEDVVVIPLAQLRTQVVVGGTITGLRHAVDGTVDWSAVHRTDL